jgi:hypothetical protein
MSLFSFRLTYSVVLGEGVSLQAGLGGAAIVLGKLLVLLICNWHFCAVAELLTLSFRPCDMLLQSSSATSFTQFSYRTHYTAPGIGVDLA